MVSTEVVGAATVDDGTVTRAEDGTTVLGVVVIGEGGSDPRVVVLPTIAAAGTGGTVVAEGTTVGATATIEGATTWPVELLAALVVGPADGSVGVDEVLVAIVPLVTVVTVVALVEEVEDTVGGVDSWTAVTTG